MHDRQKGFTLLELILSLTILAVIVTIVFGAFRIGVRAWEKGESLIEIHQRYRLVLDRIQRQISSAHAPDKNDRDRFALFKGDNAGLEFLSRRSLIPGNTAAMVYARYRVSDTQGKPRLLFYEKNRVLMDAESRSETLADEEFIELIPEMGGFEFEYLKGSVIPDKPDETLWQSAWNPENDKGLPRAVRIRFKPEEGAESVVVWAHIHSGL